MGRGAHCVLAWLAPGIGTGKSQPARPFVGAQNTRIWTVLILIGTKPISVQNGGYSCPSLDQLWLQCVMASAMVVVVGVAQASR